MNQVHISANLQLIFQHMPERHINRIRVNGVKFISVKPDRGLFLPVFQMFESLLVFRAVGIVVLMHIASVQADVYILKSFDGCFRYLVVFCISCSGEHDVRALFSDFFDQDLIIVIPARGAVRILRAFRAFATFPDVFRKGIDQVQISPFDDSGNPVYGILREFRI